MKKYKVSVQQLIDHIKTSMDVDPWAKDMAEELLNEHRDESHQKVEFIESYIKIGNSDYQWHDNHGELIRCKDCKKHFTSACPCCSSGDPYIDWIPEENWFCADGERKE